jgi:hypothetical protein
MLSIARAHAEAIVGEAHVTYMNGLRPSFHCRADASTAVTKSAKGMAFTTPDNGVTPFEPGLGAKRIDKCVDIRDGGEIVGGPTVVTIANPANFNTDGEAYDYCGTKMQF